MLNVVCGRVEQRIMLPVKRWKSAGCCLCNGGTVWDVVCGTMEQC